MSPTMKPFTFIHTADLHLDSPFLGVEHFDPPPDIIDRIRNATFTAYNNLIDLCIERKVDFLLIAGDVYNSADRSLRAQLLFRDGLRRLNTEGINVYAVHGNHDPLESWSDAIEMPENVYVFGGKHVETQLFSKDNEFCGAIHGISYPKRDIRTNLARKFKSSSKRPPSTDASEHNQNSSSTNAGDVFHIGLLHCSVGTVKEHVPYAPCSLTEDLISSGIDYWALGHVHTRAVLHERNPCVIYPGNTQGLHVNETGERGCYIVSINEKAESECEFFPLDDVRWYNEEIHINHLHTFEELEDAVEKLLEGCSSSSGTRLSITRLTLKGRGELHEYLKRSGDVDDLFNRFYRTGLQMGPPVLLCSLDNQTRRQIDIEARRSAEDLIGDFLKIAEKARLDPGLQKRVLDELEELFGYSRTKKLLNPLNEETLQSLINDAESLCVDLLIGEND